MWIFCSKRERDVNQSLRVIVENNTHKSFSTKLHFTLKTPHPNTKL